MIARILLSGLLALPLTACQRMTQLVRPSPAECTTEAVQPCEAPMLPEGRGMGESEAVDAVNDGRWTVCVLRHRAAIDCLRAVDAAGYVRFRAEAQRKEQQ